MADVKDEKEAIQGADDSVSSDLQAAVPIEKGELINASGHIQELDRNFNLLTLAGVGLVVGNVWPAVGGSILVAIFNGGAPGASIISISRTALTRFRCHL
jgi:choline transport protein